MPRAAAESRTAAESGTTAHLILTGSIVTSNYADNLGGGIYNGPKGTATVDKTIINGNSANVGGGIYSEGTLKLVGSTVSGSGAKKGGGIACLGRSELTGCTITMNGGSEGGGIIVLSGGDTTISKTAISSNYALDFGGGIDNMGSLIIKDSTITGNQVPLTRNEESVRRRDLQLWHCYHRQDHNL